MKLSEIGPAKGAVKKRKRIACGPGSGHGKTATRGTKGQNSRSGGGVPPWFEGGQMPLQRRIPKRGFTNIFKKHYQIVNLDALNRFEKGDLVNRGSLIEAGLVKKASVPVKILGRGELKVALEVEVTAASASAVQAVRDAGGSIRLLSGAEPAVPEEVPAAETEQVAETEKPIGTEGTPEAGESTGTEQASETKTGDQQTPGDEEERR